MDHLNGAPERIAGLLKLEGAQRTELVENVILRFWGQVWDLPSSEADHHARPGGLLEHSLEVAELAVRYFDRWSAPPKDRPHLWKYSAFILGLMHDAARVLSVFVEAEGEIWDPLSETLDSFAARHADRKINWIRGRGRWTDEPIGLFLYPVVLTPKVRQYGADILLEAAANYTEEARQLRRCVIGPADEASRLGTEK